MILYYLKWQFRVFPPSWTLNKPWLFDLPLPTLSRLYMLLISNGDYNVQPVPLNFSVTSDIGSLPGGVSRAVEDPYWVTKIVQKNWATQFLVGKTSEGVFGCIFTSWVQIWTQIVKIFIPSWDINLVDFGRPQLYPSKKRFALKWQAMTPSLKRCYIPLCLVHLK